MRVLRKPWFITSLMTCIFVCECASMHFIKTGWAGICCNPVEISGLCITIALSSTIITAILCGIISKNYKWPSSAIIGKFISNDIRGSYIPILLLMAFIAQFTWILDLTLDLVFKNSHKSINELGNDALSIIPPLLAIIEILFLFPFRNSKDEFFTKKDTIVSAISAGPGILWNNLDLLLKPLITNISIGAESKNFSQNIREFHIIPSPQIFSKEIQLLPDPTGEKHSNDMFPGKLGIPKQLKNGQVYTGITNSIINKGNNVIAEINELITSYNDIPEASTELRKKALVQLLTCICNHIGLHEINFQIAASTDYDSFEDMWKNCQEALKNIDSERLFLYISPGTSVPTSVLAIQSLIGERMLLYAVQNKANNNDSDIVCISQSIWTINEWYSQLSDDYNK